MLVNYEHHPVDSPYRMRFAIFVRQGDETYDRVNEIPEQLRKRTLAVRAFDDKGMMVANRLVEGRELEAAIEQLLTPDEAAYLHIHFCSRRLLRGQSGEGLRSERQCLVLVT